MSENEFQTSTKTAETPARQAESAVASPPPPPPSPRRPYRRRLANLTNVRVALADVVRELLEGELGTERGRVVVYALSTLASVIDTAKSTEELEQRLSRIEELLAARDAAAPGARRFHTVLGGARGA